MADSDDLHELEHQLERGNLFTHTALSEQAIRTNETDALLNGLVDYLVERGVVETGALLAAVEAARAEATEKGELATGGVAIRIDPEPEPPSAKVNCAERLHVCHAVCCRLRFALSAKEIEAGPVKWDLGRPYYNRQNDQGYCHRIDGASERCSIYEARPCVCRTYSCAEDPRIWTDFDAMQLNQEWIDANLDGGASTTVEISDATQMGDRGFEPRTSALSERRSNRLS
jgi:Fe-S-cluster containining protein